MSLERQAQIGNGLLIICGSVLSCFEFTRTIGCAIVVLMGVGLVFSGVANYCGWIRILATIPWNRTPDPNQDADGGWSGLPGETSSLSK